MHMALTATKAYVLIRQFNKCFQMMMQTLK